MYMPAHPAIYGNCTGPKWARLEGESQSLVLDGLCFCRINDVAVVDTSVTNAQMAQVIRRAEQSKDIVSLNVSPPTNTHTSSYVI